MTPKEKAQDFLNKFDTLQDAIQCVKEIIEETKGMVDEDSGYSSGTYWQEAERRVQEYYENDLLNLTWFLSKQCALISINREIQLLEEIRGYISDYGNRYLLIELNDLNQIKEELLKM